MTGKKQYSIKIRKTPFQHSRLPRFKVRRSLECSRCNFTYYTKLLLSCSGKCISFFDPLLLTLFDSDYLTKFSSLSFSRSLKDSSFLLQEIPVSIDNERNWNGIIFIVHFKHHVLLILCVYIISSEWRTSKWWLNFKIWITVLSNGSPCCCLLESCFPLDTIEMKAKRKS